MIKHRIASALALIPLLLISTTAFPQKKSKEVARGTPLLWRRPANISSLDLFSGPGGRKPDLRRVTFIEEQTGGYSKKYRVRDSAGREWVAKVGKEAQAKTAAVRLIWAMGYMTEINYLEPITHIAGKGTFENVRFEARPQNVKRLDEWKWSNDPFVGTRELRGLKVLMALVNNWDIKDSNNEIFLVAGPRGHELRYVISDLGATFGQSGSTPIVWRFTRSRNKPKDYANADFVDVVKDNHVFFHYGSKRHSLFNNITVQDARWMGGYSRSSQPISYGMRFVPPTTHLERSTCW
ncbi:MAG TPA: hypothetical protein VJ023_16225 [Pyrinomonadaceae bacterium]|nr:hypothetical protein [Pyrinomonadaceae bacterium]